MTHPPGPPPAAGGGSLICAATGFELEAVPDIPGAERLVSGVGIAATLVTLLSRPETARPRLLVNVGIAGAYPETGIGIGDVVIADGESWGDVGFALPDPPGFRPIIDAPFGAWYADPLPTVRPPEWTGDGPDGLRVHVARGCTVNLCTGTDEAGALRRETFGAGFESMEGAAVAAVGRAWGVPVCEIRAVSNVAGRRDMRPENIKRALDALRAYLETRPAARR